MAAKTTDAKQKKSKINGILILQIATVVALLLWMEISVTTGRVSKVFMAAPSGIVEEAVKIISNGTLQPHLLVTLEEVAVGYVLAGVVGVALALLWTLFPKTEAYGSVFCSAIMAVPKTAILPILVLWFGIGFQSKVVLIFLFSVFQILYNTLTGAKQCKEEYLKVARVFRASRVQTVFGVILPAALPSMFNGFRIAAATMQSAKGGLGYLLRESQELLNTSRMFFLIILVTLISVLLTKLVTAVEYMICHRWRKV